MNYHPPNMNGIIAAFDNFIDILHKISVISILEKYHSKTDIEVPVAFQEALHLFSTITNDSTENDCFEYIKFIKDLPSKTEFQKTEKGTVITDFYNYFYKFRDLIEHKLSVPLQQWKQAKKDATCFPEIYKQLQQEFDDVRHIVEKKRALRDKVMTEQETEEKIRKMELASDDFKSLHPFFIISNSEEHIERISALREKKMQNLEEQQKEAEGKFQQATLKFKKEIQNIFEETLKTKHFIEWLEEKNHLQLKEYEVKIKEEWDKFSREMEESRNLGKLYLEKHAIYLGIEKKKAEKERLGKQEGAAIIIQAHWRGFKTRRRLRGDIIF